ncbi:MAG: hypothetical protein JNL22_06795 [Bacteroidales bacterium]|jgi:hypothetical protein|nr:hypothetical protein [Bacteroidales bacterium]
MKISSSLILLSVFLLTSGFRALAENKSDSLVFHFPFNGNLSERNHKIKAGKSEKVKPATDRSGVADGAITFIRNTGEGAAAISLPVNISPERFPEITLCFWIKAEETYKSMTAVSGGNARLRGLTTDYSNGANRWSASAGKDGYIGGSPVLKDQWTFIALVYDADDEQARLIVNNEVFAGRARLHQGSDELLLGPLNGAMDELMIFSKILSLNEIEAISGIAVTLNTGDYPIADRSSYRKQMAEKRRSKIRPGDRYIVGYEELIIRDSINSPNTLYVFREGDTVSVISLLDKEWLMVQNQEQKKGYITAGTLESNSFKTGSNKLLFRFFNWLSQIFRFHKLSNWLLVAVFTVILVLVIRNRNELNHWFSVRGNRDPVSDGDSKSGSPVQTRRVRQLERYFPVMRPKWWMISPGLVFGLLLIVGGIWDGREMEWFFNEGASVIPSGYTLPIHWVLWTGTAAVMLLTVALFLESFTIAGLWAGLLRVAMLTLLNLMAVVVAFYLSAGFILVIVGFILFLIAAFALIGRRRY